MIGAKAAGGTQHPDIVQPFQLELPNLRGRLVRIGSLLDGVLAAHAYPLPVAHLLAETITAAIVLASLLKYEGVFTLQAKGDGPVKLLVTDVTSGGDVRAYAQFEEEHLPIVVEGRVSFAELLGAGYLAFTVDQGAETERYQGIVALEGNSINDALRHYFQQSEQLDTGMILAARHDEGHWRGGAIILQKMPEAEREIPDTAVEDSWRRGMILLGSCTDGELLDEKLAPNDLLFRLFHEEGVRVYAPTVVQKGCRCSEQRVRSVLDALPPAELESLKVDGELVVTCEFCNRSYRF
jgi:molecular chaperone Hsp33